METRTKYQPLVIVLKEGSHLAYTDDDPEKDAFNGIIKSLYECDSLSFRNLYQLHDWLSLDVNKGIIGSQVIAIIIEENLDCDYDLVSEILLLRRDHPEIKTIPTIILSWKRIVFPFKGCSNFVNGHIEIYDDLSAELAKLIGRLSSEWTTTRDWLGLDYIEKVPKLISLFEDTYKQNQQEDSDVNYSSPVDQNHMVVAEALRIKLYNGELVGRRYDHKLKEEQFELSPKNSSLQKDLKKIRDMSLEQKSDFFSRMSRTMQHIGGLGPNIGGFAIDPETLEYLIVGYGRHNYVSMLLRKHLERMDHLRTSIYKNFPCSDDNTETRFFTGTIFKRVDGIETSVLRMGWVPEEFITPNQAKDLEKVISFLKNQKKFIIIDCDNQLL